MAATSMADDGTDDKEAAAAESWNLIRLLPDSGGFPVVVITGSEVGITNPNARARCGEDGNNRAEDELAAPVPWFTRGGLGKGRGMSSASAAAGAEPGAVNTINCAGFAKANGGELGKNSLSGLTMAAMAALIADEKLLLP